jgi:hypothetical protein
MGTRIRLSSLSLSLPLLALVGLAAGCGDNTPGNGAGGAGGATGVAGQGGSSTGGSGGAGGGTIDGGPIDGSAAGAGGSSVTDGGPGGSSGGSSAGAGGSSLGGAGGAAGSVGGAGGSSAGAGGSVGGGGGSAKGGAAGSAAGAGGSAAGAGGSAAGAGGSAAGAGGSAAGAGGSAAGAGGSAAGAGGSAAGAGGSAAGAGGASTGGAGGAPTPCYTTAFTAPTAGATLTVADDSNQTCADGFQYTVTITSGAPDGTDVTLYDGATLLKTVQVSGGTASFAVQLATGGTAQQLSIQYPSTTACNVTENVTVNCPNTPPTCTISAPVISATHPDLNGVAAPIGDRTSSAGSPYQATFVVSTNAEDGQTVTLAVDNAAAPGTPVDGTPTATVSGGVATFGLTLVPDGTYEVIASCLNKNGITGTSTKSSFAVDTTAPDLTVNSPSSGQFLVGSTVSVCAQTAASDAVNLPSSLGAASNNLCVTIGSSATPLCAPVAAVNTAACVSFGCPSGGPFGLTVVLNDAAGNPTTQSLTGITCVSSLPSVQIVSPASDAPGFTDSTKHILAANAPTGVKDQDGTTPGAQADVVACTDTSGTATLSGGHKGDATLSQIGAPIPTAAAAPADNCPPGLGFVARFSGVTLPESNENADGTLAAATELAVSVTSATNSADTGTSLPDDVWVDSVPPALAFQSPPNLCGSFTQSSATVTQDVSYTADDKLVVADVTNNGVTTNYDTPAYIAGVATFGSVAFKVGQNDLVTAETDPAGNATVLATCTVTIGAAPAVTFTTPTAGRILCPSTAVDPSCIDDNDPAAGWQGSLAVHVTINGGTTPVVGSTVTFSDSTSGTTYGGAVTDASGNAQFNGATVPEGVQTLVATTDNVPNAGIGTGSVTVTVDTVAPNSPTGLSVTIPPPSIDPTARRKVLMQLTWAAPSDSGGGSVAGYQIRYAKVPIDSTNFNVPSISTAVAYAGTPAAPGDQDGISISPLYIENNYYFAVEAVDVAGSVSPIVASASSGSCTCGGNCCASHFNTAIIPSPTGTNQSFGNVMDGSGDANGDNVSDLLVGTFSDNHAYLFLGGGGNSFAPSTPSVTFTGANTGFGVKVAFIGDIDHDGFEDLAIADLPTGQRVFIFKGRATWPAALADTQADYVITTGAAYAGSNFGNSIARLGDFDGDGVDDFAIGAPLFNTRVGRIVVVYGSATFSSLALPDATNTRALEIGGDPALTRSQLGISVVGLGHFYTVTGGTTLAASAPGLGAPSNASNNEGRIYTFHGRGPGAAIDASVADNVKVGPAKGAELGGVLSNLGPVVDGFNSLGTGNTVDTFSVPGANGTGYIFSGPTASNPLANLLILYQSGVAAGTGEVLFGGGFSGRDSFVSLIGDSKPDLAIAATNISTLDIVDGSRAAGLSSPANMSSVADVHVPLPSGWTGTAASGQGLLKDMNGDGFPDFAMGNVFGTVPGRVAIFW